MDKQQIINPVKFGLGTISFSTFNIYFSILLFLFLVASCRNNRRLGVSDKELFTQQETVDTLRQALMDFDAETYMVPPGIKYTESRAVDPANPPVVIDLANRNLNIKKFDLSDYYTQVRYVKLKHPKSESGGRFIFDAGGHFKYEKGSISIEDFYVIFQRGISGSGIGSQFISMDEYIITGDAFFGIHCYDKDGTFLYTIEPTDHPNGYNASNNSISYDENNLKGYNGGLSVIGDYCLYRVREDNKNRLCLYDLTQEKRIMTRLFEKNAILLDDHVMVSYVYDPVRANENFLITFDIKGDTLCCFPNYNPVLETRPSFYPPPPDIYYYSDLLSIRQAFNDTIYRVVAPDRLVPTYVLNFGSYRADVQTFFTGNLSEKFLPDTWKESDRYILYIYTQNLNSGNNRRNGSVKFFYSYYDKLSRQLYHFSEGTNISDDEYFIENHIPNATPFLLSYADIENDQLRVCYSKKRLETLIAHKEFASLSPEQQQKLKAFQNDLGDNEVLIMILQ